MEERRKLLLIIALSAVLFVTFNSVLSFTSLDEGRNAYATREMLKTKNFVVPYYNCKERFEKPPLLYWIATVISIPFGFNEFSARLVSGLSAIGTTVMIMLIANKLKDKSVAIRSALIFMLLPHMWVESRAFVPEPLLVFFSTASIYFMINERFTISWLMIAFGFLTKGPVALIPLAIYIIAYKDKRILNIKGIILFIALGLSWYIVMLSLYGYRYFYHFFVFENWERFVGKRKLQRLPFFFFPLIVLVNYIAYLSKIKELVNLVRKNWYTTECKLLLVWFLFPLVFYSLSANKLHHYIVVSYPAISILLGLVTDTSYIKKTAIFYLPVFLAMVLGSYKYESLRFVPKVVDILKNTKDEVYFYRTENSAIVYYLSRCINKIDSEKLDKANLIITKEKFIKEIRDNCSVIEKGYELPDKLVLLRCNKGEVR